MADCETIINIVDKSPAYLVNVIDKSPVYLVNIVDHCGSTPIDTEFWNDNNFWNDNSNWIE